MKTPGFITPKFILIVSLIILILVISEWILLILASYFPSNLLIELLWIAWGAGLLFLLVTFIFLIIIVFLNSLYLSIKSRKIKRDNFIPVGLILIPTVIVFLHFYLVNFQLKLSWYILDKQFNSHFNQFVDMVDKIKAGKAIINEESVNKDFIIVPKGFPARSIHFVKGKETSTKSDLNIWFYAGLPFTHTGYVYISNETEIDKWKVSLRRIRPNWYTFEFH